MKHIIEHYEGYVTKIEGNSMLVRMEDIVGDEWEATFYIDKTLQHQEDIDWLEECGEGACFDLVLYNNESFDFRFIKERWTQEDLDRAKEEANRLAKLFRELPQDV